MDFILIKNCTSKQEELKLSKDYGNRAHTHVEHRHVS